MRKWHADRMERAEDTAGVPVMSPTAITGEPRRGGPGDPSDGKQCACSLR